MNGKGDKRRPLIVSQQIWDKNWESIFRKKEKKNEQRSISSNKNKRRKSK